MKKSDKEESVEIRVEKNGGVRIVDMDAFFAQPEVQRKRNLLKKMNLAGKKLVGFRIVPQNDPLFAKDAEPEKPSEKP